MHHSDIQLTRLTTADVCELQALSKATFSEAFASSNTEENMKDYFATSLSQERLKEEINHPGSEFYFAKLDGRDIGYLKINFAGAQTVQKHTNSLEVERIYVLQAFHGQKVGQLLLDKAIEIAQEHNLNYIWLGVWEHNLKAIRFYEKNGFTRFATHPFQLGDDIQTDLLMKLVPDA